MTRRPLAMLLVAAVCVACGGPIASSGAARPTSTGPSASATPSPTPGGVGDVPFVRITDRVPVATEAAAIRMAFDAGAAASLVSEPPPIDYATQAVLCVSLGERSTGGWSITIQSITIEGAEMRILAREGRPRPGEAVTQAFTYPSDCAVVDRTVLPVGELAVRADDTISDEFIVDAVIEVPAR